MQNIALDELAYRSTEVGERMSREDVREKMKGDPYETIPGMNSPRDDVTTRSIAAAEYPRDVLRALYTVSRGDPNYAAEYLVKTNLYKGRVSKVNPIESDMPGRVDFLSQPPYAPRK